MQNLTENKLNELESRSLFINYIKDCSINNGLIKGVNSHE